MCAPSTAYRQTATVTTVQFLVALKNSSFPHPCVERDTAEGRRYVATRRAEALTLALELYTDGVDPLSVEDVMNRISCINNRAVDRRLDAVALRAMRGARKRCRTLAQASLRVRAGRPSEQPRYTWALIGPAVARAIQQGQSWRSVVAALPPDRACTQSVYAFEKLIVARFGMALADAYRSVERAARHLDLSYVGERELASAWVKQRGAQALAAEPRHAIVAERMQLCDTGRLDLERLCARSVGRDRVAAGHSCTQVARELGLDSASLDLLRRHVALSMGVQRLHAAAGGPVDVDDLDLGPDWAAALRAVGQASRSVARNAFPAVAMRR